MWIYAVRVQPTASMPAAAAAERQTEKQGYCKFNRSKYDLLPRWRRPNCISKSVMYADRIGRRRCGPVRRLSDGMHR